MKYFINRIKTKSGISESSVLNYLLVVEYDIIENADNNRLYNSTAINNNNNNNENNNENNINLNISQDTFDLIKTSRYVCMYVCIYIYRYTLFNGILNEICDFM